MNSKWHLEGIFNWIKIKITTYRNPEEATKAEGGGLWCHLPILEKVSAFPL